MTLRNTLVTEPIRIVVGGLKEKAAGADSAAAKALSWRGLLPADGWARGVLTVVVMTLTIVLLLLLVALALYAIYHLAHAFRHHQWKEPPRRTRKYAVGKDGVSVEYMEEQVAAGEAKDSWRDDMLTGLRESLDILRQEHDDLTREVVGLAPTTRKLLTRMQVNLAIVEERVARLEDRQEISDDA